MKIIRVMTRLNIGGPSTHAAILSGLNRDRFDACLVVGRPEAGEGERSDRIRCRLIRLSALRRPLRPWWDAAALWGLATVFWRERPRIVHTHMAKAGTLGRLAALLYNRLGPGRRAGQAVILIHTFHGHVLDGYFSGWLSRSFLWVERWLARRTDCLIAVSASIRDSLLKRGVGSPEQWRVIPIGLELEPLESLPAPEDSPVLRCALVGRLVPIKNPALFLEAVARLARNGAAGRICGQVIGDGPLRAEMEQKARQLGLEEIVRFSGWRDDLPACYAGLDLVCVTSWNEGTPLSLIEAMAAGRAAVGTEVGGVRDLLGGGSRPVPEGGFLVAERGILVRSGDAAGLAAALETLARDPGLRSRLAQAGRSYAAAQFGRQRLLGDIESLYLCYATEGGNP